jgi:pilus assembly protein TadC
VSADRPWPALVAWAAALVVWSPGVALTRHRLRKLAARLSAGQIPRPPTASARDPGGAARRRWLLAGAGGLAVGLLLGGAAGAVAAVLLAVGGERLLRSAAPDERAYDRAALSRDLPGACDLLAVCLAAGVPVGQALAAVGEALPAALGGRLTGVAALYRLGAEPRRAWSEAPAELAPLGRVLVRAGESGSAVAPALRSLAADARAAARSSAEAAVQRAGVWVLAPLGLCFLPAFVCLGVVPLVLGIAGDVFG